MADPARQGENGALFNRWSAHWSGHYGKNGLMTTRIDRFHAALAECVAPGGAVLDFGCGTGEITRRLAAAGWTMTGCDSSPGMIGRAESSDDGTGVRWIRLTDSSRPSLPLESASFDGAISSSVFEYLPDPGTHMREIARVLKPGGWFLLTVPDPRHPVRKREARKIPLARFAPFWRLIRLTRWREEFAYLRISVNRWPPERWSDLLTAAGFMVEAPAACEDPLLMLLARKT